jgi:hypothetical protein
MPPTIVAAAHATRRWKSDRPAPGRPTAPDSIRSALIFVTVGRCGRCSTTQITTPPTINAAATAHAEQVLLDPVVEEKADARCRDERQQDLGDQLARRHLLRGATRQIEQLVAVVPEDREDGAELDEDLERRALGFGIVQPIGGDDQMPGRRYREEFRRAFDDPRISAFSGCMRHLGNSRGVTGDR